MLCGRFTVLLVCASAACSFAAQGSIVEDPPEVNYALQDLSEAMQIKPQFNNFLNRVSTDADKLHAALQSESAKIGDLELEKQSLQTETAQEKERLSQELETFKQKMIAKVTDLKTTNRRLEQTNMQLVATNDKLAQQLEGEKSKKELLVKKLKEMAMMFNKQQQNVQMIISQNSKRLESEVSVDVQDAMSAATAQSAPMPAAMPAPTPDFAESDDVTSKMGTESLEDEVEDVPAMPHAVPQLQRPPALSAPQSPPMLNVKSPQPAAHQRPAVPAVQKASPAVAKAIADAATRAKAAAEAKVHAEAAKAPGSLKAAAPVAAKAVPKASEDDEQLKALRSEVEKLEASVKTDDGAAAASASMLHVAKRSTKTAPASDPDASVSTLQQVGGMLSEAMADSSGDDSDSSA